MADPITLTMEDIQGSPTLMTKGALPGDQWENGDIVRKFSTEQDNRDMGIRLSEEDISGSATLQGLGAKPGDRWVDGKLIDSGSDSALTQFMYGFDKSGNVVNYLTDIIEANVGSLGKLSFDFDQGFKYQTGEEVYGEGFEEASAGDRREMILRKRERDLMQEYGPYFEEQDSTAGVVGEVAGALADPTTLTPFGAGYKTAAAVGGALGISFSTLEDLATTGEIDPEKAAIMAGIGATGGVVGTALGKGVSKLRGASVERAANRNMDQAQKVVDEHIAAGGTQSGAIDELSKLPFAKILQRDSEISGRTINMPKNQSQAQASIDRSIVSDSAISRLFSKPLNKYLGVLSARVGNISQPQVRRMRNFERNVSVNTYNSLKKAEPFLQGMKSLSAAARNNVSRHLANGEFKAAEAYMPQAMKQEFKVVQAQLKDFKQGLNDAGHEFTEIENYFPRLVKDYDGLLASMGKEKKSLIQKALEKYARTKGVPVTSLDTDTKSNIINKILRGYTLKVVDNKPSFLQPRTIQTVDDNLLKFYAPPEESLHMYMRKAVNDIERRKYFGQSFTKSPSGAADLDMSAGKLVQQEIDAGNITADQADELVSLIKSRFIGGEQNAGAISGTVRDLGYMGTIANPISAITQFGDLAISASLGGMRNTIASMFGTKNIKMVDLGIDTVAQEFSDMRKTSKLLNKLFKVSGFKAIDRLGKEIYVNATLRNNFKKVKTAKGEAAFREKWGKYYGDDIEALVADLKTGKVTDFVKAHSFDELSNVQPITMLEMPQPYLDHPNGRILYSLKSFTIKQIDIVRKEVVQEYKKGNKVEAIKKAAVLSAYYSAAGLTTKTVKDILLGRDVYVEDIPGDALWALTGIFGINKYASDKYLSKGEITEAAVNLITPATPIVDAAFKLGAAPLQDDPDLESTARAIPVIGPLIYNWFLGGAEKYNKRLKEER
jgi:hypothetical protein